MEMVQIIVLGRVILDMLHLVEHVWMYEYQHEMCNHIHQADGQMEM
jgi:hypothetical protein